MFDGIYNGYGITSPNRCSNSCISLKRSPLVTFAFLYFQEFCIHAFHDLLTFRQLFIWRCLLLTSWSCFESSNLSLRNNVPTLIFNCFVNCESYNCALTLLSWRPFDGSNVLTRVNYHFPILFKPLKNFDGVLLFIHQYS